jgi:hypothetical protein
MHYRDFLGTIGTTCLYAHSVSRPGKDQSITLPWKANSGEVPRWGVTHDRCTETFVLVGKTMPCFRCNTAGRAHREGIERAAYSTCCLAL